MDRETHVVSAIDVAAWDAAKWRGTLFLTPKIDSSPPGVGLTFLDRDSAVSIFTGLRAMVGEHDHNGILRLSFVTDDRGNTPPGYWIVFGTDPKIALITAIEEQTGEPEEIILNNRFRIYRHDCELPSPNLELFRKSFAAYQTFDLFPVIASSLPIRSADDITFLDEHAIRMNACHFKALGNTSIDDIDRLALRDAGAIS